ncbi:MAG: pilus assembly protein [Firmicutes bacterium]|nr:pilus assembly protein [Bacillota bacterium]
MPALRAGEVEHGSEARVMAGYCLRCLWKREHAQAAVEAAALGILLGLLLLGLFQFSLVRNVQIVLEIAARQAVRAATSGGDPEAAAKEVLSAYRFVDLRRTVVTHKSSPTLSRVTLLYSLRPLKVFSEAMGDPYDLRADAYMGRQVVPHVR